MGTCAGTSDWCSMPAEPAWAARGSGCLGSVQMAEILAYFLTWTTYGTWLPGDQRGWVNRHRDHGEVVEPPSAPLEAHARNILQGPPVMLDERMRRAVSVAIQDRCDALGWAVRAIEVRSNHVHVVVRAADVSPGKVMGLLRGSATRALNSVNAAAQRDRWWTRRGSKRVLNSEVSLEAAIRYVRSQDTSWMKRL